MNAVANKVESFHLGYEFNSRKLGRWIRGATTPITSREAADRAADRLRADPRYRNVEVRSRAVCGYMM